MNMKTLNADEIVQYALEKYDIHMDYSDICDFIKSGLFPVTVRTTKITISGDGITQSITDEWFEDQVSAFLEANQP